MNGRGMFALMQSWAGEEVREMHFNPPCVEKLGDDDYQALRIIICNY